MATGKIQTVLGLISPEDVGITMAHEHLAINFGAAFHPPESADKGKENIDFKMENLGWIRQHPLSHRCNLVIDGNEEFQTIVGEMAFYKENGGSTIVDNTTLGIGRDVEFLRRVAYASGVNIVAGAGYYVGITHPYSMDKMPEEHIAQQIHTEITEGCDRTDVKAGVIGEIGCSWPLTLNEKKVLRASASAQQSTGAPVIIHPGRDRQAPFEIIRVLQEAGGDLNNTVMSHLDRTLHRHDDLLEFAASGCYCEWDLFGMEVSHYDLCSSIDMPSDAQRIERIKWLIDAGYEDKITVAHDVHTKHRLMKYGGHGFSHILVNVVPKMLDRGYTKEQVNKILIHNPSKWLTFK